MTAQKTPPPVSKKVRITDICNATGLSRSTVDRAINGRGQVHPRTVEHIRNALRVLSDMPVDARPEDAPPVDVLLRLGKGMAFQMKQVFDRLRNPTDRYFDLFQLNEETILRQLQEVCADTSRAAIVTVKDTDRVHSVLSSARRAGKRIIALISDLEQECRNGFVGIDNKAAGSTAAYMIAQALGNRPATVGVAVGDHAFRCHEDREIGFRSTLREIAPRVILAAEAKGEDNPEKTYHAIRRMLEAHPGMGAIYNVSGGNAGLARALRELGIDQDMVVILHELTSVTVPILIDGTLNYSISQDPTALMSCAIQMARSPLLEGDPSKQVDFGVFTRFNLPAYAKGLPGEEIWAVGHDGSW
ncbi:LacI family DNA-binding transcriptional regulator [Oceanicola sp. 502str15]|uniref:LacI family DNA-binding transcriptional regulator n=1 Tax=Oceanicola sp. 502str15 TaxID=2696061 RepID=UPI002095E69A|nr:LacI family DNA-binding transcriptional regulator [Oceanicola sp. 502str15]MCO6385352.1 substrate-binding domain-containing protein [Oceanicola sp. 502str15]